MFTQLLPIFFDPVTLAIALAWLFTVVALAGFAIVAIPLLWFAGYCIVQIIRAVFT